MRILELFIGNKTETDPVAVGPGDPPRDNAKLQFAQTLTAPRGTSRLADCQRAWKQLERHMALVPAGTLLMFPPAANGHGSVGGGMPLTFAEIPLSADAFEVHTFYIDKLAVTNQEFSQFVQAGGYQETDWWPSHIWPNVMRWVDQTGRAGPRFWRDGRPERSKLDHPVTGISWYEARAYAHWVGKQLPNAPQWQRAATWHHTEHDQPQGSRFPWGDSFDASRSNVWASRIGTTVPVKQFPQGSTPNGVYQLIGNVWEWTDDPFCLNDESRDHESNQWAEIRGGAFDTYLANQASAWFRSGQRKMARENNTGFRCAIPAADLTYIPEHQ